MSNQQRPPKEHGYCRHCQTRTVHLQRESEWECMACGRTSSQLASDVPASRRRHL